MGREARVQRDSPKSGTKKRRQVRIWTAEDLKNVITAMATAKTDEPKTLTITTGGDE